MSGDNSKTTRIAIPTRVLYDWLSGNKRISFGAAWRIIAKLYCGRLFSGGTCPLANGRDCADCKPYIMRIFDLNEAQNPEALASWIAKKQAAIANEIFREAQRAPSSDTGSQDGRPKPESNPFEVFLTTLE